MFEVIKDKVAERWDSWVVMGRGITFLALTVSIAYLVGYAWWSLFTLGLPELVRTALAVSTAVTTVYSSSLVAKVCTKIGKD